jgi:hypothetical protein
MLIPIHGPGRIQFQGQGASASVNIPTNAPLGDLSVVTIGDLG